MKKLILQFILISLLAELIFKRILWQFLRKNIKLLFLQLSLQFLHIFPTFYHSLNFYKHFKVKISKIRSAVFEL